MGTLIIFVVGFVCGALFVLYLRRSGSGRDLTAPPRFAPPPMQHVGADSVDEAEILALVREGRKIDAVKRVRDITGLGLAEAVEAVEAMERAQR